MTGTGPLCAVYRLDPEQVRRAFAEFRLAVQMEYLRERGIVVQHRQHRTPEETSDE